MAKMTPDKAVKRFWEEYNRAVKQKFVRNPVAYALYAVWKEADNGKAD